METGISLDQTMRIVGDFFKQIKDMDIYTYNASMLIGDIKNSIKKGYAGRVKPDEMIQISIPGRLFTRIVEFNAVDVPSTYNKIDLIL